MKKIPFFALLIAAIVTASCQQDPPVKKYKLYTNEVLGASGWCCEDDGTDCYYEGSGVIPTGLLRTYIEQDRIADFFRFENWQSYFPSLADETDLINSVINTNPKGLIINDELFVLLKDRNLPFSAANAYFAVMLKAGVKCNKFLGIGGV